MAGALKSTGDIELQALGVVPQTIFLRTRSLQADPLRRIPETPRLSRMPSIEQGFGGAGAPFEDLRRRLATINGSTSSLNSVSVARDRRSSLASVPPVNAATVTNLPATLEMRPGSPTESVVSTTNSVSLRHRFHVGSTDSQKAAPAIGSIRANAIGLLEAPSKSRSEASPERSGRSSPISITDTVRGVRRRFLPVQSYG